MITKNKVITTLSLISAALFVALILAMVFKPKVKPIVPVTISTPNTSYLASQHIDTVYLSHNVDPKPSTPILIDTTKPTVPPLTPGDTVYVVLDYFTGKTYFYHYKDSILDFQANIYSYSNQVFTIDPKYTYKEKVVTITNNIVSIPKLSLSIGGGITYGPKQADIVPELGLTRNRHVLDISYGILRQEVGVTYKYIILYK